MFLGSELDNYFGIWELSLVGFQLRTLASLMIGTGERYLVGLSLGLQLRSPLDSPNTGTDLPGTLLGAPIRLWFGSDVLWGYLFLESLPLELLSHLNKFSKALPTDGVDNLFIFTHLVDPCLLL